MTHATPKFAPGDTPAVALPPGQERMTRRDRRTGAVTQLRPGDRVTVEAVNPPGEWYANTPTYTCLTDRGIRVLMDETMLAIGAGPLKPPAEPEKSRLTLFDADKE